MRKDMSLTSCDWLCEQIAVQMCIGRDRVQPDSRLTMDLGMDSLEMQNLLLTVEDWFDVMPNGLQLHRVTTVDQLHHLVVALVEARDATMPSHVK